MNRQHDNATVTLALFKGASNKPELKTIRGRVTARRVFASTRTFDRNGGKCITPYRPGMMKILLVSFETDDGTNAMYAPQSMCLVRVRR